MFDGFLCGRCCKLLIFDFTQTRHNNITGQVIKATSQHRQLEISYFDTKVIVQFVWQIRWFPYILPLLFCAPFVRPSRHLKSVFYIFFMTDCDGDVPTLWLPPLYILYRFSLVSCLFCLLFYVHISVYGLRKRNDYFSTQHSVINRCELPRNSIVKMFINKHQTNGFVWCFFFVLFVFSLSHKRMTLIFQMRTGEQTNGQV